MTSETPYGFFRFLVAERSSLRVLLLRRSALGLFRDCRTIHSYSNPYDHSVASEMLVFC